MRPWRWDECCVWTSLELCLVLLLLLTREVQHALQPEVQPVLKSPEPPIKPCIWGRAARTSSLSRLIQVTSRILQPYMRLGQEGVRHLALFCLTVGLALGITGRGGQEESNVG